MYTISLKSFQFLTPRAYDDWITAYESSTVSSTIGAKKIKRIC